jgi:hypothetical protein
MVVACMSFLLVLKCSFSQSPSDSEKWKTCVMKVGCSEIRIDIYNLAQHQDFQFLIGRYSKASSEVKEYIVQSVYGSHKGIDNRAVIDFMSRLAFTPGAFDRFSEERWYALQFLAERCNPRALRLLEAGAGNAKKPYAYQVTCNEWANSLSAFGSCRYTNAKESLVSSLGSSCLDVSIAAEKSLEKLYPKKCTDIKDTLKVVSCFEHQ